MGPAERDFLPEGDFGLERGDAPDTVFGADDRRKWFGRPRGIFVTLENFTFGYCCCRCLLNRTRLTTGLDGARSNYFRVWTIRTKYAYSTSVSLSNVCNWRFQLRAGLFWKIQIVVNIDNTPKAQLLGRVASNTFLIHGIALFLLRKCSKSQSVSLTLQLPFC